MTNFNERLDEALSILYNSAWVEGSNYDENNPEGSDIPSKREIAKTAAAKQAITSLIKELVEEAIKKPHILPKNAQHLESVKQGINFYHRQMRKRVDKLKEQL